MATNKNAQLRYNALDKCFSNQYKKFFIDDLIDYCSLVLTDHYVKETKVSRRQIFDDIDFMKSDAGFNAPIVSYKDGRKVYYRYDDPEFSILKTPINPAELDSLREALATLNRLNSLPGFDWVASLQAKLQSGLNTDSSNQQIISFEENEFLKGVEYLNQLFQYISNKQVLEIVYKSFKSDKESSFLISPYYLKQYNNRWFLFGWNHKLSVIQNLALDRIKSLQQSKDSFIKSEENFDEYFDDIIGVSNDPTKKAEKISIKLTPNIIPYISSKPIHGSQKIKENILTIEVKHNYELESLILSYGENMRVLQPETLKESLSNRISKMH
ncbi:WYL domain-containing protein [Soonwooa sp.]|uniref:helix-turn-helix transcriptional regulator n=1 Tax=Soonwooa sp. TaxID=1938592 RepID=UPI002633A6B4|nr:WYL domain-containing protein [Soonwooa sp.]